MSEISIITGEPTSYLENVHGQIMIDRSPVDLFSSHHKGTPPYPAWGDNGEISLRKICCKWPRYLPNATAGQIIGTVVLAHLDVINLFTSNSDGRDAVRMQSDAVTAASSSKSILFHCSSKAGTYLGTYPAIS